MKNLLFFTLLLSVGSVDAQHKSAWPNNFISRPDAEIVKGIFQKQHAAVNKAAPKTTATQKRLIATTYASYGNLEDSTQYYYSSGRGSTHPNNFYYAGNFSPFDQNFKQPDIKYDIRQRWFDNAGSFDMLTTDTLRYDNENNVISMTGEYMNDAFFYGIKYNTQKLPDTIIAGENAQDIDAKRYITCDAQNRAISESTFSITNNRPTWKGEYSYDANGNQTQCSFYNFNNITSSWTLSGRTSYTYDNQNRLIYDFSESVVGGTMRNVSRDSFAYTGNAAQYTYSSSYYWNVSLNAWKPDEILTFKLNNQNYIDSFHVYRWNVTQARYDTIERTTLVYDNNNLLQYSQGYLYQGNGIFESVAYDKQTYYWQEYDPTSIKTVLNNNSISIYPNPSTGIFRINTSQPLSGTIALYNCMGQRVSNEKITEQRSHSIDLSDQPAGVYNIVIEDIKKGTRHQAKCTKL